MRIVFDKHGNVKYLSRQKRKWSFEFEEQIRSIYMEKNDGCSRVIRVFEDRREDKAK